MANVSNVDEKYCASTECAKKGKKPASEFNVARDRHDGLQAYCKDCSRAKQRAYKKRVKEKPAAVVEQTKREKVTKSSERDAKLREQMELNDKMYAAAPSLSGSTLGPHID